MATKIRQSNLDNTVLTGHTELSEVPADNDTVLIFDATAGAIKKIQRGEKLILNGMARDYHQRENLFKGLKDAYDDDLILIYDTSADALKKILASNVAPTLTHVSRTATGDGSTAAFTVTNGTAVANVLVFVNGVVQRPTTDYSISGTSLTFGTAPAASDRIDIRELPR